MNQMSLLDLLRSPPQRQPVDPHGPVVQGEIDFILSLPHPRLAWPLAQIEVHRHDDGRWMWATEACGSYYRVGPKWGKFAVTRDDALYYAAVEIVERCAGIRDPSSYCVTASQLRQIRDWAQAIADAPAEQKASAQ